MIMTPVYAAYSVAVLGLVGGAPAQGGPGGGGDTARRRFIGGGRVCRVFHNSAPPSKQNRLGTPPEPCMSEC